MTFFKQIQSKDVDTFKLEKTNERLILLEN